MSLAFLSPGSAADALGFHPLARSPIDRAQRDRGAVFAERDGWLVPASIPGEDERLHAGVADLSHLGKIEVRTDPTAGWQADAAWGIAHRISPRRTLLLGPSRETADRLDRLAGDPAVRLALDVTAAHAVVAVTGSERWTVVRRLTHLHHAPSSGEVAHVNAVHLLEIDDVVWLICPQELGEYLWEVAVDRAEPLGGGPVGVDAIPGASPDA